MKPSLTAAQIQIHAAQQLYGELTGRHLSLRFDRERQWIELLRTGFTLEDVRHVSFGRKLQEAGDDVCQVLEWLREAAAAWAGPAVSPDAAVAAATPGN